MEPKYEKDARESKPYKLQEEPTISESPSVTGCAACFDGAQDALNRMKRAQKRGTGCHLTAGMIRSLYLSFIGEMWGDDDPREKP